MGSNGHWKASQGSLAFGRPGYLHRFGRVIFEPVRVLDRSISVVLAYVSAGVLEFMKITRLRDASPGVGDKT